MTRQQAVKYRHSIEKAVPSLSDKDASQCVELFGTMKYDGSLIEVNTRINWKGELKRARVALWDTEQNDPDHAPTLWETVLYRDGIRVIPANIPAEDPFYKGDLGWWGDLLYKSIMEGANVYIPAQYAMGWELVKG